MHVQEALQDDSEDAGLAAFLEDYYTKESIRGDSASEDTGGLSTTSITDVLYEGTQITFGESALDIICFNT